jgi:methanethiol S-methyltransferase
MKRIAFFTYGVLAHVLFLGVYAYLMAFVGGFLVPRHIDGPGEAGLAIALAINLGIMLLFGVQHSVMARPGFKQWWTRIVPKPIERSTYVLISCLLLIALFAFWQPITAPIWDVQHPGARAALWTLFAAGWLLVPIASLMINHFDLFGTRQVWLYLRGQKYTHLPFRTPMLYQRIRHPLYVGWLIAFWAAPTMTAGHLLFAFVMSSYIFIAVQFEERDLQKFYGQQYAAYRQRVPMLIPRPGAVVRHEDELAPQEASA